MTGRRRISSRLTIIKHISLPTELLVAINTMAGSYDPAEVFLAENQRALD
jgi:hypothetical protein